MRAHCAQARFRDRSRPCFIACACDVHATFKQLSSMWSLQSAQDRVHGLARGQASYWLRCLDAVSAGHFGAKWEHSFCSKRRYDEEKSFNGHSFLPAKRGASSTEPPFFWSLGIRGRNQWKEPCFQDWSTSSSFDERKMLGCCRHIVRRSEGRLSESNAFSRRDESSLIHGVRRRVRLVAWLRKWCRMAVNDAFAAQWQDTDLTRPKCCTLDVLDVQHESLGKHRWRSRSLIINLLQTRATSVWQGIISGWIQWVKHACTSCTPYRRTGKEILWIWLWTASFGLGSQWGTVSKIKNTNKPHGSGEDQDSKLGNSLTLVFLVSKHVIRHDLIPLEVMRMTMYEENSMDFCITTLG